MLHEPKFNVEASNPGLNVFIFFCSIRINEKDKKKVNVMEGKAASIKKSFRQRGTLVQNPDRHVRKSLLQVGHEAMVYRIDANLSNWNNRGPVPAKSADNLNRHRVNEIVHKDSVSSP